jgi:hypothetical protein
MRTTALPRRVGLVTLVGLAVATLAYTAVAALTATRDGLQPASVDAGDQGFDVNRCIQRRINERIPVGAAIAVVDTYSLAAQGIIAGLYPRYDVTEHARDAEYTIRVDLVPSAPCAATTIMIRRRL